MPEPEPQTRTQFEDRCVMTQFEPAVGAREYWSTAING